MSMTGHVEPAVVETAREMVPAQDASGLALVVERLAANPGVDVDKLQKIIELQERVLRHEAKSAFDGAFAMMQSDMPEIGERGQILVKGQLRSTYAKLEDIHAAIKPVLKTHGFAIRHRTEWPEDRKGTIRIVGILSHRQGHSEESSFEAPMDKSDFRTDIQSMGSTVSYGRRYTTLDLLNLTTRGLDDDGATAGRPAPPAAPKGFEDWWDDFQLIAENGIKPLEAEWKQAKAEFKTHLVTTNRTAWENLKRKASAVKA